MHVRLMNSVTPFDQGLTGRGAAMLDPSSGRGLAHRSPSRPALIGHANGFKLLMALTLIACPLLIPSVALAPPRQ